MAPRLITFVLGTRPEAIKLAPVIHAVQAAPGFEARAWSSAASTV